MSPHGRVLEAFDAEIETREDYAFTHMANTIYTLLRQTRNVNAVAATIQNSDDPYLSRAALVLRWFDAMYCIRDPMRHGKQWVWRLFRSLGPLPKVFVGIALRNVILPFVVHDLLSNRSTIDAIAPLLCFVSHTSFGESETFRILCNPDTMTQYLPGIRTPMSFSYMSCFISHNLTHVKRPTAMLQQYVTFLLECPCDDLSHACVIAMNSCGMTKGILMWDTRITQLLRRYLYNEYESLFALLRDVVEAQPCGAVLVMDYVQNVVEQLDDVPVASFTRRLARLCTLCVKKMPYRDISFLEPIAHESGCPHWQTVRDAIASRPLCATECNPWRVPNRAIESALP